MPGIFFKYDLEAMTLIIRERTTSFYQFLIRLIGVIGGVWTVAAFGLRVVDRAQKEVFKSKRSDKEYIPSSIPGSSPAPRHETGASYFPSNAMSRATSWATEKGEHSVDWRSR